MITKLLIKTSLFVILAIYCQNANCQHESGYIYVKGITWITNQKQDSIKKIIIEGDTMITIKNLLIYCMQEKEENYYAGTLLSLVNLDLLKSILKNKDFDFYLKKYRLILDKNKKYRDENFPECRH
jgi:hypothetical protein